MDIKLIGGMDGIETAIQLRQKLDIPVLFLTAFADASTLERAKLAEPLGYLVKPYDQNGLRAGIEMAHYKARTERLQKESESRLHEKESLQRLLLENINAGIVIIDADTHNIERVNKKGVELFGSTEDRIVGRVCHCFLCPAETGCCPVTDLGQDVDNSERILLRADGRHLPILKSVKHFRIDGRDKLLETYIDISGLKRMEAALHASEEKHRLLIENSQDIIYTLSLEGIFTFISPSRTALLGVPRGGGYRQALPFIYSSGRSASLHGVYESG